QGHRFDLGEITAPVEREIARLEKSHLPEMLDQADELSAKLKRFKARNAQGPKFDPLDVNRMKTDAQALADAGDDPFHELIAQRTKQLLEGLDKEPGLLQRGELGVAARNLKTQGLMGVQ